MCGDFALISAALYFVDDEVATGPWGLSYEEKETLPRTWFDASVDALYRSDFLAVPRVESVQTICVLTLCGHNFGATTLLTNLLHIGIKLAVSLGYDKLLPETPTSPNAGRVQRELGRRMWACLYVGEALSPVATQPDALFTECARTAQPANIDDENLTDERAFESKPMSTTTYMTHLICVWRLAHRHRLFCRAFQSATSVKARFQAVKEYSRQLDHVFDDTELGPTSVVATPAHPQSFDYRPWSRRILKDGVERQQINAWRLFLRRAYVDADYAEARQACLTLARSILAEASKASPRMYEKAWYVCLRSHFASELTVPAGRRQTRSWERPSSSPTSTPMPRSATRTRRPFSPRSQSILRELSSQRSAMSGKRSVSCAR